MNTHTHTLENFKFSKFTIRRKLISITLLILFASLGGMIFVASNYFKSESKLRIQENNLEIIKYTSKWLSAELKNLRKESKDITRDLLKGNESMLSRFFNENPHILFVGFTKTATQLNVDGYNEKQLKIKKIKVSQLKKNFQQVRRYINSVSKGKNILFNASNGEVPLLGILYKLAGGIVILYVDPSYILEDFNIDKNTNLFIVNEYGEIILHTNHKAIITRKNIAENSFIKKMWASSVRSSSRIYLNKEDNYEYLASYTKLTNESVAIVLEVKEEFIFAPVERIENYNLIIMLIFMLVSILIYYYFAKIITSPIIALVKASDKVANGDYNINIISKAKDEIGWLIHSFLNMVKGLGEREKIKDAFGRFVNKEIAEKVMKGEVTLGGERKFVAVFFSDLRGFTSRSENMEPENVVSYLNDYFTEMVKCIELTHGVVDKYIGDAIMAHWGAIGDHGNETENSIQSALMMREALIKFNQTKKYPITKIGCGINTGEALAGQIGSKNRLEYTVIGDTVNLASRVESLNKEMGTDILITKNSYDLVKNIFKVQAMKAITVKGKSEMQQTYAVLGRLDDPQCPKSIEELRAKLGIKLEA